MENSLDATVSSFIEYQNQFSSIIEKLKEGHQNGRFADWKGVITVLLSINQKYCLWE